MMVNVIHRPVKLVQASHVPVVTGTFLPETKRRVVWPVAHDDQRDEGIPLGFERLVLAARKDPAE